MERFYTTAALWSKSAVTSATTQPTSPPLTTSPANGAVRSPGDGRLADGKIEAYVGPHTLGGADDLEQVIVDFIKGARKRLDIAVQELDSEAIVQIWLESWV